MKKLSVHLRGYFTHPTCHSFNLSINSYSFSEGSQRGFNSNTGGIFFNEKSSTSIDLTAFPSCKKSELLGADKARLYHKI